MPLLKEVAMIKELEKRTEEFIEAVKNAAEKYTTEELKERARAEKAPVFACAAVYNAVKEGLGLTPFDSQIMAGGYLDDEAVVELPTGEGKTIAAVFAAYYSVCMGEPVHILTFNDYLAKRDRSWMKPVYDLLGVTTAYITEKTPETDRREAYKADVLYITVKECGFDFLRDFLVFDEKDTVGRGYIRAIVDEADSVLIDEARIPLVAAGKMSAEQDAELPQIFDFVKTLSEKDYELSEETGNAYLTSEGERKTEAFYNVENIYDEENNELLGKINDCLKALYILTEDKDYIVKEGAVKIIDLFTGRIAENRSYPGFLQAAVEIKHGLKVTERGVIMGSVPIQFFLRQYGRVSGMTGTAETARDEFNTLYGLTVKTVKPHVPSQRVDLPMAVYFDEDSKLKAVVSEIKAANQKGQPVLVGTDSIEQSERLSELLKSEGIEHNVLNAKNDEQEAEIISNAGLPSAVTISTNMAGRGVDIKLGGADEKYRDEAVSSGGLYAIGTFMAESVRINDQLRGRAARQGDPGQSRIFVSLDEEIMTVNKLKSLIPSRKYPEKTTEEITDKTVIKEVSRIQRISQGKTLDDRERLLKFTMIGEKHRDITFGARKAYLTGERAFSFWEDNYPDEYSEAVEKYGKEKVAEKEREYILGVINLEWSRYLEFTSYLREGIHLSAIGGKNPADEYNIGCEEYYETIEERITEAMGEGILDLIGKGIEDFSVPKPLGISTYLLEDSGDELNKKSFMEMLLGEGTEEYDENYYEEESEEEPAAEAETSSEKSKKGFFGRLFGKK